MRNRHVIAILAAVVILLVTAYILHNEIETRRDAIQKIDRHANVIANALWGLDREGPQDYLRLAIQDGSYEKLTVRTSDGGLFFLGTGSPLASDTDRWLARLKLIPEFPVAAEIKRDDQVIGTIEASVRIKTIYEDLYAVLLGGLFFLAVRLYRQVLATNRDLDLKVQERTRTIQQSAARFRSLIENIADGILLADANGVAFFETDTTGKVLGYPNNEFMGQAVSDVAHPNDRSAILGVLSEALARPDALIQVPASRFRHRDGRWVWIEGTAVNRLSDPNIQGIVLNYRDVTSRIEAQQALRKSEVLYRAIVETAEEAIVMTDFEGRILLTNRRFSELTGYSSQELSGKSLEMVIFPEDRELIRSKLALRKLGISDQYDLRLCNKDGGVVPVLVSAGSVRAPDGSTLGAVKLMTDISVRKSLEDQLRQAQKMEAIGVLAGGISHDFNNVLTVILGYVNLLLKNFRPDDQIYPDLDEIRSSALRAADLTRQLLAFSRQQVLRPRVIDLNEILSDQAKMLRRILGEDIQFIMNPSAEATPVFADPIQIDQVVLNLAVNARDAMPRGGTLTVTVLRSEMDTLNAQQLGLKPGPYGLINVKDTGHGMDKVTMARIFDPFFTTKPPGKGTGLGLSTVFGIIRQSNGAIEVKSEPEKGTEFRIWIPIAGDQDIEPAPVPESIPKKDLSTGHSLQRGTILVVEDDEKVRKFVYTILSRSGYEVLTAASGGDALIIFEKQADRVDLVLSDLVMPVMAGDELVQRLRQSDPELRVILMSGNPSWRTKDVEIPADIPFLEKPFGPEALLECVQRVLGS